MELSPDQISGWLLRHNQIQISHELIYHDILSDQQTSGDMSKHLHSPKKRRKRYGRQVHREN